MPAGDLVAVVVDPVRRQLEATLAPLWPAPAVAGAGALIPAVAVATVGVLLARAAQARAAVREPELAGGVGDGVLSAGAVTVAAALLVWIARHPSAQFHELFARGDHLVFAVLVGFVLVRASPAWRPWLATLLSLGFLCQYSGPLAVGVGLAAGLVGFVAVRASAGRPWVLVVVHAAIGLAVYRLCWRMRGHDLIGALQTYGLFSFLFLRQISFAVGASQGRAGGIGNYLCYLVFYPGVTGPLGGPEVWSEFARRNLGDRTDADYAWAARRVVRGM